MPTALDGDPTWLGDLALNVTDDDGIDWIVTGNDAWSASSATTLQIQQRQADHGGWPGTSFFTPKAIPLVVTIIAPSAILRDQAITALLDAATLTATTMRVKEAAYDRSRSVRRQGEPLIAKYGNAADVSLPLVAPDPRLYSSTAYTASCGLPSVTGGLTLPMTLPMTISAVVSSGSIPLGNAGKIDTLPLLRITGPVVQPVITLQRSDGIIQQLTYQGSLLDGDYLDLDCGNHTAILNGSAGRRGLLTVVGGWPAIPRDPDDSSATSTLFFNCASTTGAPTLTVSWNDAWG